MGKKNDGEPPSLYAELMRATAQNATETLKEKLKQARDEDKLDDNLLRLALQNCAKRGHEASAQVLLEAGAKTDISGDKGSPALFWAVSQPQSKGHLAVAKLLIHGKYKGCPADMEWGDENGRTILMSAAWRGHKEALTLLLDAGANVNARDKAGRNILHNLAADKSDKKDKKMRWDLEVVSMLLARPIDLDIRDSKYRAPLHWACVLGKVEFAELLLARQRYPKATVNLRTQRGKTALHLACDSEPPNPATVALLLRHGADPSIRSDGHFTCLHNTTSMQNNVEIVKLILERDPSLINATTSPGYTPLHFAAIAGSTDTVEYLLSFPETNLNAKDSFYTTPLIRAAQEGHLDIVDRLAPFNNTNRLSSLALRACHGFDATIVDFRTGADRNNLVQKRSVFEVLYGKEKNGEAIISTLVQNVKGKSKTAAKHGQKVDPRPPKFRWIHLPANNMAWVEALVAKYFVESRAADIEGFKSVEKGFSQQHRGPKFHSHFMRPLCVRTARGITSNDKAQPYGAVESAIRMGAASGTGRAADIASSPERLSRRTSFQPGYGGPAHSRNGRREADLEEEAEGGLPELNPQMNGTPPLPKSPRNFDAAAGRDSPGRSNRQPNRRRRRGNLASSDNTTGSDPLDLPPNPLTRVDSIAATEASVKSSSSAKSKDHYVGSNITLFMPYLHFETDERRRKMREAVRNAESRRKAGDQSKMPSTYDETLIWAHLHSSTGLHMRRTLDQFYLHGIDTEQRDQDQVVYRYCRDKGKEVKLFMVDQLWLWILGPGLIITAFPQRWQQPKDDPLNVLDGLIEDLNSKLGDSVQSVYDLALLISGRCSGSFDRHRPGDEDFQFLDMFESSIGNVNDQETALYNQFYEASFKIHTWLSNNNASWKGGTYYKSQAYDEYPDDVNRFIDIGEETKLLQEIKDIRDELNMISMCLNQQRNTLPSFSDAMCEDTGKANQHGKTREIKRKIEEQKKIVEVNLSELSRMGRLAAGIEDSLINLLDLKQKQSNALEARFARDQAQGTVRQGQIIMVFTMVTIIFLPMSFMAAFFAIDIHEFPHNKNNGNQELHLGWVLKYLLGIGLGISVLLIGIAFSLNPISAFAQSIQARWNSRPRARSRKEKTPTLVVESAKSETYLGIADIYGLPKISKEMRRSMETDRSAAPGLTKVFSKQSNPSRRISYVRDLERGSGTA